MKKAFVITGITILFIVVTLCGCTEESIPKTITVGIDGDYITIQEAINNANNGDTIQVKLGTYMENIVINKPLTLQGNSPENTFIDGGKEGHVIDIKSNYIVITGFTIRNSGRSSLATESGIYINEGFSNCQINNNIISNNNWGIYLYSSNYNIISDNTITSNEAHGIRPWESDGNQIINNLVTNNKNGMLLGRSDSNIITDNNISSNNGGGIVIDGSNSNQITDNIISSNHRYGMMIQPGIEYDSNSNTIIRNTITLNGQYGIFLNCPNMDTDVTGNQITYNTIQNNNAHGHTTGEIKDTCSGNIIENND